MLRVLPRFSLCSLKFKDDIFEDKSSITIILSST